MIPTLTQQQIDGATRRFDLIDRRSQSWLGWENQPGNEFVLLYNNKIYPIKHILSMAGKLSETSLDDLEALTYFLDKANWKVSIQPLEKYLNPVNPVILPVADIDLYNYRLLEKRIELFKRGPHKTFTSAFYWEDERKYKLEAVERHQLTLSQEKLGSFIERGEFYQGAAIIKENFQKDNLLYKPWEVLPFLNIPEEVLVRSLYHLLYGEEDFKRRLETWIELLTKEKPLCWPAATYHLMMHDPTIHIFIKPGTIGKLLRDVGSKLQWQPRTNPGFYFQVQRFASAIMPTLASLGARDMLDVQSFSWIVRGFD